jgi:small-conductance mechanosensitive channel
MRITELGIEVRLACFVEDYVQRFDTEIELREELHRALTQEGIKLAVPQRIVRLQDGLSSKPVAFADDARMDEKS